MIRFFFTKQFVEFLMVGGFSALINWLSRIILGNWTSYSRSVVIAYGIGMMVAFVLNSLLVFPKSKKAKIKQARDFMLINLIFFPVVWGAALMLEPICYSFGFGSYSEAIAHAIAISLPTLITFLLYKLFAFKDIEYGRK